MALIGSVNFNMKSPVGLITLQLGCHFHRTFRLINVLRYFKSYTDEYGKHKDCRQSNNVENFLYYQ